MIPCDAVDRARALGKQCSGRAPGEVMGPRELSGSSREKRTRCLREASLAGGWGAEPPREAVPCCPTAGRGGAVFVCVHVHVQARSETWDPSTEPQGESLRTKKGEGGGLAGS